MFVKPKFNEDQLPVKIRPLTGQAVIEVLIAVSIITIIFMAVLVAVSGSRSLIFDKKFSSEAQAMSSEGLEAMKSIATRDWTALVDGDYGLIFQNNEWELSTSTDSLGILTRNINIASTTDCNTKLVKSTVSWNPDPLRSAKIALTMTLTDWKGVLDSGGDTGGCAPSGDWKNPKTLGSIDLGPGNSATGLDVINKIVYLTTVASSDAKPDFHIVDATDGQNPVVVSDLQTGDGLNAIDVAGNYAYVAQDDDDAQLQIINVSDINSPGLTASFKLPGVSGGGAVGNSIFFYNDRVYIGTKNASGTEFHIINVSNPGSPVDLGSLEIGADVNRIIVTGTTALLSTSNDSKELVILNISDPSNITEIGYYDATGAFDANSEYLVGSKLYMGRSFTNSTDKELYVLKISNPGSVPSLGSKDLSTTINDLKIRNSLAFIATSDSNKEFQIWNIADPANITFWSSFNFPQVATGIDYENNIVYVSVRSNDALRIITSQ